MSSFVSPAILGNYRRPPTAEAAAIRTLAVRRLHAASLAGLTLLLAACQAHTPTQPAAAPLYVASDYQGDGVFTHLIEAPAVGPDGALYLVGLGDARNIARIAPQGGKPEVFATLPAGSAGNGIRFDRQGRMLVADYTAHNILRVDMRTRQASVFAHLAGASQPNDIALAPDGTLYASDPDWKHDSGQLWRIAANGTVTRLETGMGTTNGIAVSPDGKRLYVNESVQRRLWAYDIAPDGTLSHKRLLRQFADHGMDGMRCDERGNLYLARYGAGEIAILSPDGALLRNVKLRGQKPTNVAFGGADGRTVYVTLQDRGAVESFRSEYPGRFRQADAQGSGAP